MRKTKLLLFFILFFLSADAQDYPGAPVNYVTDNAGVLSESQQSNLNAKLKAFEDSTSNQIFVYITNSLNGRVMSELCQEIFHNWKIGASGKNNGVLIGVFVDDHKFRIHTGYGLEGALPDILTKRIQDLDMKPHFKLDDYYTGIDRGVDKLIYYSAHEFEAENTSSITTKSSSNKSLMLSYVPNIILLFLVWHYSRKKLKKNRGALLKREREKKERNRKILLVIAILLAVIPCVGAIILFIILASFINFGSSGGGGGSWSSSDSDSSSSWSSSDSSSDSGSDFSGGGGGDSGGGGSDSDW